MADPSDEIVALRFKTAHSDQIVFDVAECRRRVEAGQSFEMITRERMQLMAAADLGPQWVRAAQSPTLLFKSQLEAFDDQTPC